MQANFLKSNFLSNTFKLRRASNDRLLKWYINVLYFRNGTSMISLIIPPKDQISRIAKMLADEFGTASNIKSRVNRLSVLGAITSVQQRLKLYNKGDQLSLTILFIGVFYHGKIIIFPAINVCVKEWTMESILHYILSKHKITIGSLLICMNKCWK